MIDKIAQIWAIVLWIAIVPSLVGLVWTGDPHWLVTAIVCFVWAVVTWTVFE